MFARWFGSSPRSKADPKSPTPSEAPLHTVLNGRVTKNRQDIRPALSPLSVKKEELASLSSPRVADEGNGYPEENPEIDELEADIRDVFRIGDNPNDNQKILSGIRRETRPAGIVNLRRSADGTAPEAGESVADDEDDRMTDGDEDDETEEEDEEVDSEGEEAADDSDDEDY